MHSVPYTAGIMCWETLRTEPLEIVTLQGCRLQVAHLGEDVYDGHSKPSFFNRTEEVEVVRLDLPQ